MSTAASNTVRHLGGCHCGAIRYEVDAPGELVVRDCNCSICVMSGHLHLIVPKTAFRLLKGQDALTEYRFNTGTARHFFCKHCGVKSFYVPRSKPDGYSVNARCLDAATISSLKIETFNGQNWEAGRHALATLLRPENDE